MGGQKPGLGELFPAFAHCRRNLVSCQPDHQLGLFIGICHFCPLVRKGSPMGTRGMVPKMPSRKDFQRVKTHLSLVKKLPPGNVVGFNPRQDNSEVINDSSHFFIFGGISQIDRVGLSDPYQRWIRVWCILGSGRDR